MGLTHLNLPNGLTSFGGIVLPYGRGKVFWVDSTTGQDAPSNGDSPDNPFDTINYAITQTVASRGDIILVLPGHAETVSAAAGVLFNKASVSVIGLGSGSDRPTITLGTVDTATISITAANCMLVNCIVDITAVDGIDVGIAVSAQYFTLRDCYVLGGDSGGQCDAMVATGATTTGTGFKAINNTFQASTTAGVVSGIDIVGTPDLWEIVNNRFFGVYSGAPINNETGNVATNGAIEWNFIENKHATALAIDLDSACTGVIRYNTGWTAVDPAGAGVSIDGGSMAEAENYINSTVDTSALLEPVLET